MDENRIRAFAKQLSELAERLQDSNAIPATTFNMNFLAGDKSVGFSGPDAEQCQELFSRFYQESGWSDKYSEAYVSDLLRSVLGGLYESNNAAAVEAALSRYSSDYQAYQKSHVVLVPLFGIAINVPQFLSCLAKAKAYDSAVVSEYKAKALALLDNNADSDSTFSRLAPVLLRTFGMDAEFRKRTQDLLRNAEPQYREWLEAVQASKP
jgi:hypothetical protein